MGKNTDVPRKHGHFSAQKSHQASTKLSCVPCARTGGWQLVQPDGRMLALIRCDLVKKKTAKTVSVNGQGESKNVSKKRDGNIKSSE